MIKTLVDGCEPTRGSKYSACIDLYASEDVVIEAGSTKLVGLGVCFDPIDISYLSEKFKKMHYVQLMLRSSLSKHLVIANGVGVIDLDYEDEIKIRLHNPVDNDTLLEIYRGYAHSNHKGFKISKGDKIAQITLMEHKSYLFGVDTEAKRTGGFGSTDGDKNEVS